MYNLRCPYEGAAGTRSQPKLEMRTHSTHFLLRSGRCRVAPVTFSLAVVTPLVFPSPSQVWDHVLTFGDEVSKIWSRKFSGATVLYCLLRYGTLVEKMSVMFLASWNMSPHWASGVDRYGCELAYLASPVVHDRSECYFFYGEVATNAVVVRIAGIIGDILSETIVIIVTFMKTYRLRKDLEPAAVKMGLAQLLFRDVRPRRKFPVTLKKASHLMMPGTKPQPVVGYDYWVVPYYTPVTIIICRFLLMLRAIYYNDDDNDTGTQVLSMRFASGVVGPLGTTVDPDSDDDYNGNGDDEDDDDDDESIPRGNIEGVVFSKDPFAAGMGLTKTRGKEKEAPVEVSV
ncbi:hypothetical protein DXG01_015384 [Tephrocybe rancida]|nr:hypothetical protein DXG01_015384 [Tephrocybe rancida]